MSNEPDITTSPYSTPVTDPIPSSAEIAGVAAQEATLGARIGDYLIDTVVIILISFVVSFVLGLVSSSLSMIGALVALAYAVLRDCLPFLNGQSIGKKIMKIKAVTEDGKSLSGNWGPGIIRNVVLFIPLFPLVELIVLASAKGKPLRRLGDQWAKTKVIVAP